MKERKLPIIIWKKGKGKNLTGVLLLGLFLFSIFLLLVSVYPWYYYREAEQPVIGNYKRTAHFVRLNGDSFVFTPLPSISKEKELSSSQPETKNLQPIPPVEGRIVQEFGWRKQKNNGFEEWRYIPGIDLEVQGTHKVKAILPGKVELIRRGSDLRYTVTVSHHQKNLQSVYGHCTEVEVKAGDNISQGQSIAKISGSLHLRLLQNKQPIDPKEYFAN